MAIKIQGTTIIDDSRNLLSGNTVTASSFVGPLTGNAATATTLQTARTITISGAATGTATSFNGSANITIPVTDLNASNLNAGTVPDARLSGTYTGFTHKIDGVNTIFTTPNTGSSNTLARTVYGLAEYRSASSEQLGAIVFIAPNTTLNIMHQLEVQGLLFNENIFRMTVQGFRTTSGTWSDTRKISFGTVDIQTRWAVTPDGKSCLILGDVGSSWRYPHFSIVRAMFSHLGTNDSYCSGWSVSAVTDLTGYTQLTGNIADSTLIGNISGNSTTATTLQTSRAINGTPFNGSSNIITARWGTARNITIGDTTKSVDGSVAISWSLAEIGAADRTLSLTAGDGLSGGGNLTADFSISHADTSTQASVNNSNGTVIQDITLDTYGHITGLTSANLDGRYYTETESNTLFIRKIGTVLTNIDTQYTSGIYYGYGGAHVNATPGTNPFPTFNGAFNVFVSSVDLGTTDEYITQTAIIFSSIESVLSISYRAKPAGVSWSPWKRIIDSNDLQTSSEDATVGKLMGVGAFGLGVNANTNSPASLDTITATGFYRYASTTTGAPGSAGIVLHLTRISTSSAAGLLQMAFDISGKTFTRYLTNTVGPIWSEWTELYSQISAVGVVSQTGGVPTGAIIERGSNANGEYTKWADGTMIVTKTLTGLGPINTASGSVFISPSAISIGTLAATFISPPKRFMSPIDGGVFFPSSTFVEPTVSDGGNCTLMKPVTSAATDFVLDVMFVGRWF